MMIAHFTTVHPRTDTRILLKQCRTLAKRGDVSVSLFVSDGRGEDCAHDVHTLDTGMVTGGRLRRATQGAWRMYRAVKQAKPNVAHFHDPELIPVGLALKFSGIKVVYDVHEDLPRQILNKYWIPQSMRRFIAWGAACIEWIAGKAFDAIVPATPTIAARFPKHKTVVVQNFPILDELILPEMQRYEARPPAFAYVGGITRERGIMEMLQALAKFPVEVDARLELAGAFNPAELEVEAKVLPGWERVDFHDWADRHAVAKLLDRTRAGIVLFHPLPNHVDAQPNKMFEYMAAGLPVIASDFPLWRQIIDGAGCGLLVDPLDPDAIAKALSWILDNPAEAAVMGRRGRQAVEEKYNWDAEAAKLLALYDRLLTAH
jgi:glycosyltransferase involved in cell wall biosynthesis